MNEDIFNPAPTNGEPETNLDLGLNDLVGEGRKYKNPDELAKAYANIENHAKRLEAENARIRAEQDAREANTNTGTGREQPPTDDNPDATPTPKAPNSEDFRSQIREEVKALNDSERAKANAEAAATRMIEVYGDAEKARQALAAKAAELQVSTEWLRDSASRSPAAFYATMGLGAGQTQGSRSTPASGETVRLNNGNESVKNFEYFDKMRKEDPKLYFSATTQREMMNNARTMGSDFYKR